jgi:hypothetical protein
MRPYKLLPILAFVFFSCAENEKQGNSTNVDATNKSVFTDTTESFETFNERFHRDSVFQLSRIAFPIGGHFAEGENSHEWTAGNWELLKEPVRETINAKEYEHNLQKTDTTVIEKYWIENSGFKVERRFKKIGSKWFLTYYDDINL